MSYIEEKDAVETMVEMAEIAARDGYCGAWYSLEPNAEVGALCMKRVAKPGDSCEECEQRMTNWNLGVETEWKLVPAGRRRP